MSTSEDKIIKDEEKKRFIMKVGVIVFSFIILALWVFSLSFSFNSKKNSTTEIASDWREELQETIDTARQNFNITPTENTEEKKFLDDMLEDINNKEQEEVLIINPADIEKSTSTASSTESQKFLKELENKLPIKDTRTLNCPAYINCMPTIGVSRPCVIPSGCEDITQIVY
jgi:transketolase